MSLYTRLQATANRLITKYGQVGEIKRLVEPDPVLGGDPVPQTFPVKIVPMTYDQRYINGTTILTTDRQVYISAIGADVVPQAGDIVTAGGIDYLIIDGDPNNYDGITNVIYIIQGRII